MKLIILSRNLRYEYDSSFRIYSFDVAPLSENHFNFPSSVDKKLLFTGR
jgi:hypothetical protein